jgi:hypothetical protein
MDEYPSTMLNITKASRAKDQDVNRKSLTRIGSDGRANMIVISDKTNKYHEY